MISSSLWSPSEEKIPINYIVPDDAQSFPEEERELRQDEAPHAADWECFPVPTTTP